MKNTPRFTFVLFFMSMAILACGLFASTKPAQPIGAEANTQTNGGAAIATPTVIPGSSPTPSIAKLELEVVQFQAWTDRDENVRVVVLLRNPYDFPVAPGFGGHASLLNSDGKFMRDAGLYFLDGISGGNGFVLPGETIAANACFTCERSPLTEAWSSVRFTADIKDASENWEYSTEVEITVSDVSFDGDSPIFWITGTVRNNSTSLLDRVSARVFVFDQAGNLVGAAEASAWDVGAGATANFNGYGIGKTPDGPVTYEATVLGVKY